MMGNLANIIASGRDTGNLLHQISPFENILFYDELLDDDNYNYELIEEMFNPKKKIKISKDKAAAISRINTEGNDSNSSLQENVTYQALQRLHFPNNHRGI